MEIITAIALVQIQSTSYYKKLHFSVPVSDGKTFRIFCCTFEDLKTKFKNFPRQEKIKDSFKVWQPYKGFITTVNVFLKIHRTNNFET